MKLSPPVIKVGIIWNSSPAEDNQKSYTKYKNICVKAKRVKNYYDNVELPVQDSEGTEVQGR